MQDTFWTPELWCEFLNQRPLIGALEVEMEQFKSSKSPKKEWEIVAYAGDIGFGSRVYELCDDGEYRWKADLDKCPRSAKKLVNLGCTIYSVRRLSDGEVFTVGDRIKPNAAHHPIAITQFSATDNVLRIHNKDGYFLSGEQYWELMQKLPQPILTTVDGVEIYSWGNFKPAVVFDDFSIRIDAYEDYWMTAKTKYPDAKIFSTRQAAEEYILNSRPLLSLNDVKEAIGSNDVFGTLALRERLTSLVKQKLNQ